MKLIERVGQGNEEEKKGDEKPVSKAYAKKLAKKNKAKGGAEVPAEGEQPTEAAPAEEEKKAEAPLIPFEERKVDYRSDFFRKPAFLTVSGQINVETYACGMGDVYTFGPTFRAEHSDTARHLAEFWMIEPEMVFAELPDVMDCAEDYVKFCLRYVMENNADDIEFFNTTVDTSLKARLMNIIETPFTRLTYTEAITIID
jgi:asparaginyl-tRNA synthetase